MGDNTGEAVVTGSLEQAARLNTAKEKALKPRLVLKDCPIWSLILTRRTEVKTAAFQPEV